MLCTRVCFLLKLLIHLTFSTYMVHVVQQQHEVNNQLERHAQLGPCKYLLAPDSLSTVFAFLEAFSSVDMIQGHYDSVWWSWLCLLRRVYLVSPHDEFSSSSSSVYEPHMYTYHVIRMIPGTIPAFPQDRHKHFIRMFAKVRFSKCTSLKIVPKAAFAVHFLKKGKNVLYRR